MQTLKELKETDLIALLVQRSTRAVSELIETTWEMQTAKTRLECSKKSRVELLHDAYGEDCKWETTGEGLSFAIELLSDNNVARNIFTNFIKTALESGRGK